MILIRILIVGLLWSILFLEGIRVIMLTNWHFDIFRVSHWLYAWNLWLSGWVIDDPKEWAFILIIITFIPVWLTGWGSLSMINWDKIIKKIINFPFKILQKLIEKPVNKIASTASVKVVKKKKSYKEIRPRSIRPPMEENAYSISPEKRASLTGVPVKSQSKSFAPMSAKPAAQQPKEFNHSLFKLDEEDNFDFDLFEEPKQDDVKKEETAEKESKQDNNKNKKNTPVQKNNQPVRSNTNSTLEILKQKGYEVISGASIKNIPIDFIGVSKTQICLCLNDKEPGDWLADEERFNDEEPLWFSESSHRISPVRKIDIAKNTLKEKLSSNNFSFEIEAYVIEQIGNIINAEDMFEIWNNMNINVTRIDRGTPKEIKLFSKALEDADGKIEKDTFEKLKKMIRSIG